MKRKDTLVIGMTGLCAAAVFSLMGMHHIKQSTSVDAVTEHENPTVADTVSQNQNDTAIPLTGKTDVDEMKAYDPSVYAAPDPSDAPTKYEIYYKCLNTLEKLDQLSGNITIYNQRLGEITEGSFAFDFSVDQYHAEIEHTYCDDAAVSLTRSEFYNHAGHCISLYDYMGEKPNAYTEEFHGPNMDGIVWSDKANIYNTYGKDPTNAHELGVCFIPQEMSIGYLKNFDNWEVVDVMDWNGRECYSIQGVAEPEYGSRFDVDTFQIWVDQETGIWYQYEGYSVDGELTDCFYTENIQFGDAAQEVKPFSDEAR